MRSPRLVARARYAVASTRKRRPYCRVFALRTRMTVAGAAHRHSQLRRYSLNSRCPCCGIFLMYLVAAMKLDRDRLLKKISSHTTCRLLFFSTALLCFCFVSPHRTLMPVLGQERGSDGSRIPRGPTGATQSSRDGRATSRSSRAPGTSTLLLCSLLYPILYSSILCLSSFWKNLMRRLYPFFVSLFIEEIKVHENKSIPSDVLLFRDL